jgi:hypothetical protein
MQDFYGELPLTKTFNKLQPKLLENGPDLQLVVSGQFTRKLTMACDHSMVAQLHLQQC